MKTADSCTSGTASLPDMTASAVETMISVPASRSETLLMSNGRENLVSNLMATEEGIEHLQQPPNDFSTGRESLGTLLRNPTNIPATRTASLQTPTAALQDQTSVITGTDKDILSQAFESSGLAAFLDCLATTTVSSEQEK